MTIRRAGLVVLWVILSPTSSRARGPVVPDLSKYEQKCGVIAREQGGRLGLEWPIAGGERASMALRFEEGRPLIESLAIDGDVLLAEADPCVFLTVGSREQAKGRPPGMSVFNEFFDNPARRPSAEHAGRFVPRSARVTSRGRGLTVAVGDLEAGPFRGEWRITVFPNSRLVKVEAVVRTAEADRAFLYDAGVVWEPTGDARLEWVDSLGGSRAETLPKSAVDRAIAVRHRAAAVGAGAGSVVISPPPHQFFFPRDYTDNVRTIWAGRGHRGGDPRFGLGIRQDATGGGNYVPWFNAPPGTDQHLAMFLLISKARTAAALAEMREYTRGDTFADLPGRITYTSHYHMAVAVAAMKAKAEGRAKEQTPSFVKMFKDMNVNAVHLGEFHGDGHQFDPGPLRLPEMKAMFDECKRLSDQDFLLIPGEEISRFLGKAAPGREPGHWMSLFPRPVYWILDRKPGQPLVEDDPRFGKVYRVGDARDAMDVVRREGGLVWTAHPRIKASSWAPDASFDEPYFRDDRWLGAAWKAMPADLSKDRLGTRGLDLLDEMSNRGARKYLPGEVDVFTLDPSHELYGHMNINYLKADALPAFDGGWHPILDALRAGKFFTTTGEVLIREFTVDGAESGEIKMPADPDAATVRLAIESTYPLEFAEIVSGDGQAVHRVRIPLDGIDAFGKFASSTRMGLRGRTWARLEAWDVAGNGAYTQPVWLGDR